MSYYRDRQKLSWEGIFYSVQRIDLLIVSICSAGIYICLETLKFLSSNNQEVGYLLKISGLLFVLGVITNFISQFFGLKTNEKDYLMCQVKIDCEELGETENDKKEYREYELASKKFSTRTNILNYTSMAFLSLGLLTLLLYFFVTF